MRLTIKSESPKEKGPIVEFSLEENEGTIHVMANGWYLLEFRPDGAVHRNLSLSKDIGFPVDAYGRLIIL